ncbi:MAG: CPBP family intramembrane metalloprotease [Saprospiraceae bacterium]|nr:CPBP family intramembrane metalloprotease [Saprospiraceae bacterium]
MRSLWENLGIDAEKRHVYVLLLSAPVLLTLYYYQGRPAQFAAWFPAWAAAPDADLYARFWQFFCFFILTGVLPLLYGRWAMRLSLEDLGLGLGDWKLGLPLVLLLVPLVVAPLIWVAAGMPDIQGEYPMLRRLLVEPQYFWRYEIAYILLYYVAWEFYFRGFLLFGLAREWGPVPAILIQTISSCLIHLGKPESETIGSILVGILFGVVALRTRSVWYVMAIHAAIGVLTDFFVLQHAR